MILTNQMINGKYKWDVDFDNMTIQQISPVICSQLIMFFMSGTDLLMMKLADSNGLGESVPKVVQEAYVQIEIEKVLSED